MDETEIKYVVEAALLAAGRPLTLDRLSDLFAGKAPGVDKATVKRALEALAADYQGRGIELGEVSSGFRIQVRRSMSDWLVPLWEEKAPRYTRALLETLALVAYRQPITRAEIEEVRGVVVSTNIMRTLLERNWVRVVGHRDVPGKPAMFGTTREFLDYFGLRKLEDLPPLAELKDGLPELSPQTDLIESLEAEARGELPPALIEGEVVASGDAQVGSADAEAIDGADEHEVEESFESEPAADDSASASGEELLATLEDAAAEDDDFDDEDEGDDDDDFDDADDDERDARTGDAEAAEGAETPEAAEPPSTADAAGPADADPDAQSDDEPDSDSDEDERDEPQSADVIPLRASTSKRSDPE